MIKALYNCAQDVLYTILDMAWDNFDFYLTDFGNYKAGYTSTTSADGRALIDTAEALPNEETRGEVAESLRIELAPIGEACTENFQKLKGYIRSSWGKDLWKPKFEAAGQNYYAAASNNDWDKVKAMNTAMKNFIAANGTVLATDTNGNANMPAGFNTTVTTASTAFNAKYAAFLMASNTEASTAAKIAANNAAFKAVTELMFPDAQVIFKADSEVSKLFVFENLQQMIDPQTQGIRGFVLNDDTLVKEEGVTVTIQKIGDPPSVIMTNPHGRFLKIQQSEGPHKVKLEKTGLVTLEVVENFKVGTVIRRKYVMKKV